MPELWLDAVADQTLTRLEASTDPRDRDLLERLEAVLEQLAIDPGDVSVRGRRFQSGLWLVTIRGRVGEDDWVVLWEPHMENPEDVMVHYVGPASFA